MKWDWAPEYMQSSSLPVFPPPSLDGHEGEETKTRGRRSLAVLGQSCHDPTGVFPVTQLALTLNLKYTRLIYFYIK